MGPFSVFLQGPLSVVTALLLIMVAFFLGWAPIMIAFFLGWAAKGLHVAQMALDHKETNMGPSSVFLQSPLGVVTALLLIMVTFFLGWAAKGRREAQMALDHKETNLGNPSLEERESSIPDDHEQTNRDNSSLEEAEPPSAGADIVVPDIFLSHSGKDKLFVESLYKALQSTNHTVFFDQHTLPEGVPFPPQIEKAAKCCKVGVVVLSEDFLVSKGPMKELEMLVLPKDPTHCVLPLFYRLNPADLSSSENLLKWRCEWKKMGGEDRSEQWEQVVKDFKHFNGEVYKKGTSPGAYVKKVVQRISALITCHVLYDCSWIQGQARLAQEIATNFEHLGASQACMVGLHGVGGLGKTTLSKVMVNYYTSHYSGKSFLIEVPSLGEDTSTIVSQCKQALNRLTDASNEHLLNKAHSFDEVVALMKDLVGRHDVFLAIDNVWESSLEVAKRILEVGFNAKSKILVTSRSEDVLKDLVMVRDFRNNAKVAPLPAPKHEEAFQIFQEAFESDDLSVLVDSEQMDNVLGICSFSGSYNALALKALGNHVKRVCDTSDSKGSKHDLPCILEKISCEVLTDVDDLIQHSYDSLPEQKKHMFLDIVVVFLRKVAYCGLSYADVDEWIISLYWKLPKGQTTRLINELSLDGLIQIEVDKVGGKKVQLHDLYRGLAERNIASSPRFLIDGITESAEEIEWEKLEVVMLEDDRLDPFIFEKLQQCKKCPKLRMLTASDIEMKSGFWLNSMPSLSVLSLSLMRIFKNQHASATTDSGWEKENVAQSHLLQPLEQAPGMPSLDQEGTIKNSRPSFVTGEGLVDASHILHLNGLVELRKLDVVFCSLFEGIAGLDALGNLRWVHISDCNFKSLDGLRGLFKLQYLYVSSCKKLQNLPDMSSLIRLESLQLTFNEAMEEVGGEYLSSTLKHLKISSCTSLRSCPSLDKCMHMETLTTGCAHHISSLHKLSNLKDLTVCQYGVLELEIGDISALKELKIWSCASLKKLIVGCASLKTLNVWDCHALEEITGNLEAPPSLEELHIEEIIGDLKVPPSLENLSISHCPSLKKLEGISSTPLKGLSMRECGSFQESSIPEGILPRPGMGVLNIERY